MRLLRRYFWYIEAFLSRYRYIIIASLGLSVVCYLVFRLITPLIPQPKNIYHIGAVGTYTLQELPEIVDRILASSLTTTDNNMRIVPKLTLDWQIDESGKNYVFHLKPNLFWPDGTPFTSSEINLSIPGVTITYPDNLTIHFSTPEVFSPFPSILTHSIFNSKGQTPTGYTVTVVQANTGNLKNIKLESDKDQVIINIFSSISTATTAFKLGQIDYLYDLSLAPDIVSSKNVTISISTDYEKVVTLFFNTGDPIFANKSIRQSIAYLLSDKTFGYPKAVSPIHPSSWAFNPLVKTYDFNAERGHQLLSDNLSTDKRSLTIELSTLPEYLDVAENIKYQLDKQNITLIIRVVTNTPENFQLFLGDVNIPKDPDQYQLWHSTQKSNITKINEPKLDILLENGRTTIDQKARKQIYLDFQRTLLEELPALFLYFPNIYQVSRGNPIF